MAFEKTESFVILKHPSGASVKILKYGATVIDWTSPSGAQNLFLSEYDRLSIYLIQAPQSWMDQELFVEGSPLYSPLVYRLIARCFLLVRSCRQFWYQVFGKSSDHPTATLAQHGFARTSTWRLTSESENSATFTLTHDDLDATTRKLWGLEFRLVYTVELAESELHTQLEVHNLGTEGFECNTLLHTYLRIEVR